MSLHRLTVNGIAVDGTGTIVRDDAIWIEPVPGGWRVLVSVADACEAVEPGNEAFLSERSGGKFRRELSLSEGASVPSVTLETVILEGGVLKSFRVFRSMLQLSACLTSIDDEAATDRDGLRGIGQAALELRRWRLAKWDQRLTQPGKVRLERALHELLVCANIAATSFMQKRDRGLVFTAQAVLTAQGTGRQWSVVPEAIEMLMASAYASCTTPLNRYADLVNLRCLLAAADGAPEPYSKDDLTAIAAYQTSSSGFFRTVTVSAPDDFTALSQTAFAQMISDACIAGEAPAGLDGEIRRRLLNGTVFVATLPLILLHTDSPASAETRALALAVLRGADEGRGLVTFWKLADEMLGGDGIRPQLPRGSEVDGYEVIVQRDKLSAVGRGVSPGVARLVAMGRLAAIASGLDPESPVLPDGRLCRLPKVELSMSLAGLGWPQVTAQTTVREGKGYDVETSVVVVDPLGHTTTFIGRHLLRSVAVGEACEAALAALPLMPPAAPGLIEHEWIHEIADRHQGYPDRILNGICKRAGMPPPEVDKLAASPGSARCRVAVASLSLGTCRWQRADHSNRRCCQPARKSLR